MAEDTEGDGGNVTPLDPKRRRPKPTPPPAEKIDTRAQKAAMILGPDCPYVPLGLDGDSHYVIDHNRQVRNLRPRDMSRTGLVTIAGSRWLEQRYPRTRKGKPVNGFANEKAADELHEACSVMGFWTPDDHQRGLGAWVGDDGELVLHRGGNLWTRGKYVPLGRYGDFVYVPRPVLPEIPKPVGDTIKLAPSLIISKLDSFHWSRGAYDANLAFGWICCAMLGAALEAWRPHLWIGADAGSGKTTLQTLLMALFGAHGILSVTDASAAGLWQQIGCDCIPIGVDEIEASADPDKQMGVVKLIRQASSGALILRGGAGHVGASFTVKSAFLCTSVIIPPLPAQDASRVVTLQLLRDAPGTFRAVPNFESLAPVGAALLRRLAEQYGRLVRQVIPAVRMQMLEAGFSTRLADVYGPLWAARDVASEDEFSAERLKEWLAHPLTVAMRDQALAETTPEWQRCADWLQSTRSDRNKPESDTFGDLITRGAASLLNPPRRLIQQNLFDADGNEISGDEDRESVNARNRLLRFGMKLEHRRNAEGSGRVVLLIAASHRALAEVFQSSPWRTLAEAATGGGWAQVLRRAPGAETTKNPVRFRGVRSRAVVLPIELILGTGAPDTDQAPSEAEVADFQARPGDAVH